jgi:chromosome partitioning protein
MAKVISVALRKGGSGKTTTSVNVAAGLLKRGKRVLLVDLDDQANATMCVGLNPFELERSIATLFTDIAIETKDVIVSTAFGLDVLPATQRLEQVGAGMNATSIKELSIILSSVQDAYDYIIIDTQPGHSYLSISALVASDYVLIPLQAHYLAMEGVARILGDIERVQHGDIVESFRGPNANLQIIGIVPCMIQPTNISRGVVKKTREDYPGWVLPVEVRLLVDFVNATLEGVPLVIAQPKHTGALEYLAVVDLLLSKMEGENGEG